MRETLPRLFPGVTFAFLPADMVSQILNFGVPAPIDLQVVGNNLAADRQYANDLLARVARIPGVADARIEQTFDEPTLDVNLNRSLAGLVGVTEQDATDSMLTSLAGSTQTYQTFWLNRKTGVSYPVSIQTPQYDLDTLRGLKNLPLTGQGGGTQRLGGLATIRRTATDAVVSHYNVQPVIDIYATPQQRSLGDVAAAIHRVVRATAHEVPRGADVVLRGQVQTMTSAYGQLYVGLALAVVLIYLLIVVNYQSWIDPLVIVCALPIAIAGMASMLFATDTTLSVPALTGAIMAMGVAIANSILVISFARERMGAGADAISAALEAGRTRLRPVPMTALAMIIGMIPMAIEPGENGPHDTVVFHTVQIGRDLGNTLEVVAGLSPTDRVIDSPPETLESGEEVRLETEPPPAQLLAARSPQNRPE
jgi:multidrug efflux pump subunit AcrB